MKTDSIPDIYLEQYVLGELPENLRKDIDALLQKDPELIRRIAEIKNSDSDILATYPAELMASRIIGRKRIVKLSAEQSRPGNIRKPGLSERMLSISGALNSFLQNMNSRRFVLSIASASVIIFMILFTIPGIIGTNGILKQSGDDVRIKGLDSKLILYRIKGKEVEELKNLSTAKNGDIIQAAYIATGGYRHGMIISIDGRGTVTKHFPENGNPAGELVMNQKILLNKSYELDDSPSFERFIMILSPGPIDTDKVIEKAKKLAISSEKAENGSVKIGEDLIEYSIILKKADRRRDIK